MKTLLPLLFLVLIHTSSKALENKYPFLNDWQDRGSFNIDSFDRELNFENAYWLAALSQYSYWDQKLVLPFLKAPLDSKVQITFFENKFRHKYHDVVKDFDSVKVNMLGFGFNDVQFFSSRKIANPINYDKDSSSYLTTKWISPLPLEACAKGDKLYCFSRFTQVLSTQSGLSEDERKNCGEHLEKVFYSTEELSRLNLTQKNIILSYTRKYEEKNHLDLGLNFESPDFKYRCDSYRNSQSDSLDSQLMWLENDDVVIIIFRGTEFNEPKDVETDRDSDLIVLDDIKLFEFFPIDGSLLLNQMSHENTISVHQGFYKSLLEAAPFLKSKFSQLIKGQTLNGGKAKSIFVTGHSMGGSMAQLLAYAILSYNETVPIFQPEKKFLLKPIYTFASPRLGNKSWSDRFNYLVSKNQISNFRFIYGDDPVVHTPCAEYSGAGTVVHIRFNSESSVYSISKNPNQSDYDDSSCAYGKDLFTNLFNFRSHIRDHSLANYYNSLKTIH